MNRRLTNAAVPVLAGLLCVAAEWSVARVGYSVGDEGFLLVNTLKTLHGFIPVVDMYSYDPGRYYWSAAWMTVLASPDLVGLRISIGLLLGLALAATIGVQRHALSAHPSILPWIAIFLLWMGPRHKGYDVAISLLTVAAGYLLLVAGPRRTFAAGIFVGAAALFGRNHGLYTTLQIGFLLLVCCRLHAKPVVRAAALFAAGVVVGYAPEWLLMLLEPGFFDKFNNMNRMLLSHGSTNLALPVPWPWLVDWNGANTFGAVLRFSTGLGFVLMPSVVLVSATFLAVKFLRKSIPPTRADLLLLSATVAALPYSHHAFSRAELFHLAQGIAPTLVAASCLIHGQLRGRRRSLAVVLSVWVGFASLAALNLQPAFTLAYLGSGAFTAIEIGGETIRVGNADAKIIARVTAGLRAAGAFEPGSKVFIAPHWPGLYPVLGQDCPTYNSYFIFPESPAIQQQMIDQIEAGAVSHVVVGNTTIDGRAEFGFATTNPLLLRHIQSRFTKLADQDPLFSVWVRSPRSG